MIHHKHTPYVQGQNIQYYHLIQTAHLFIKIHYCAALSIVMDLVGRGVSVAASTFTSHCWGASGTWFEFGQRPNLGHKLNFHRTLQNSANWHI